MVKLLPCLVTLNAIKVGLQEIWEQPIGTFIDIILCIRLFQFQCYECTEKKKTSMMWPSQNFLLYIRNFIKMKATEWINNLK